MQAEQEHSKGENFFFFLTRLLAFSVTSIVWITIGLPVWLWIVLRTVMSFSFAMAIGLLHGGRDFSGASRSLQDVSGLWWRGALQICDMLDPNKSPRIQQAIPFDSRKVIIDGIFTLCLVVVLFFGEQAFRVGVLAPLSSWVRRHDPDAPRIAKIRNTTKDNVVFSYHISNHENVMAVLPKQSIFVPFPTVGPVKVGIYENNKTTEWTLSYDPSSASNSAGENNVAFDIQRDNAGKTVFEVAPAQNN